MYRITIKAWGGKNVEKEEIWKIRYIYLPLISYIAIGPHPQGLVLEKWTNNFIFDSIDLMKEVNPKKGRI